MTAVKLFFFDFPRIVPIKKTFPLSSFQQRTKIICKVSIQKYIRDVSLEISKLNYNKYIVIVRAIFTLKAFLEISPTVKAKMNKTAERNRDLKPQQ